MMVTRVVVLIVVGVVVVVLFSSVNRCTAALTHTACVVIELWVVVAVEEKLISIRMLSYCKFFFFSCLFGSVISLVMLVLVVVVLSMVLFVGVSFTSDADSDANSH